MIWWHQTVRGDDTADNSNPKGFAKETCTAALRRKSRMDLKRDKSSGVWLCHFVKYGTYLKVQLTRWQYLLSWKFRSIYTGISKLNQNMGQILLTSYHFICLTFFVSFFPFFLSFLTSPKCDNIQHNSYNMKHNTVINKYFTRKAGIEIFWKFKSLPQKSKF